MTDNAVYRFLAARRKAIAGTLGMAGVLAAGGLLPHAQTTLVIQAIFAFLGVYGIHEVANDNYPPGAHYAGD